MIILAVKPKVRQPAPPAPQQGPIIAMTTFDDFLAVFSVRILLLSTPYAYSRAKK